MKKKFAAFLREENSLRELTMTDAGKPPIDPIFLKRWQGVFNLVAVEADAPVVLVLRVREDSLNVLLKSDNADQSNVEHYLQNGLYCMSAAGKSGLLVANKAADESNADDPAGLPSVKACFGLPIQWPDEALFGVVCVLNNPGKKLKPAYRNVLSGLKTMLEQDLALLEEQRQTPQAPEPEKMPLISKPEAEQAPPVVQMQPQIQQTPDTDALTSICSRKKIEDILKHEFDRAKRYFKTFSVTMIDLKGFQKINDSYGRDAADEILKAFAKSVGSKIRETDFWGRWGGDEFVLVCPYADTVETQQMITRIKPLVNRDMKAHVAFTDFYFGVSQYEPDDLTFQAIVKRAEENLDHYEEMTKRKAFAPPEDRNANSR